MLVIPVSEKQSQESPWGPLAVQVNQIHELQDSVLTNTMENNWEEHSQCLSLVSKQNVYLCTCMSHASTHTHTQIGRHTEEGKEREKEKLRRLLYLTGGDDTTIQHSQWGAIHCLYHTCLQVEAEITYFNCFIGQSQASYSEA